MIDFPELPTPLAEKKEPPDKAGGLHKNGVSGTSPPENPEQKALKYQEIQRNSPEVSVNKKAEKKIRRRTIIL